MKIKHLIERNILNSNRSSYNIMRMTRLANHDALPISEMHFRGRRKQGKKRLIKCIIFQSIKQLISDSCVHGRIGLLNGDLEWLDAITLVCWFNCQEKGPKTVNKCETISLKL